VRTDLVAAGGADACLAALDAHPKAPRVRDAAQLALSRLVGGAFGPPGPGPALDPREAVKAAVEAARAEIAARRQPSA